MPKLKPYCVLLLLLSASLLAQQSTGQRKPLIGSRRSVMPAKPVQNADAARTFSPVVNRATQPQMPAPLPAFQPPATPARLVPEQPLVVPQMPVAPPANPDDAIKVDFQRGLLTVSASNAELGKVLHLIGTRTGAEVEVAPELATEPVAVHLGPGAPNEILAALLNSPRIDFIIMGSDQEGRVQKLLVRRRASFGGESVARLALHQRQEAINNQLVPSSDVSATETAQTEAPESNTAIEQQSQTQGQDQQAPAPQNPPQE